ncbi:hypothetical protein ACEXTD_003022 [Salmonella enterica]
MCLTLQKKEGRMNEHKVLSYINSGDGDAGDLLDDAMPTAARRFYRLTQSMHTLLEEVREHFPDAMFYSANGKVSLLLGSSHNKHDQPVQEMVAVSATKLHIEGGDW